LNEKVVEYAVKAGLALNCTITQYAKFGPEKLFLSRSAESIPDLTALSAHLPGRNGSD
jgi:hypothetical protein